MLKKVFFDNYDSFTDFNLILSSKTIEVPEPKTSEVDIDGMDGVLDLTDYFGEVAYKNRKLTLEFSTVDVQASDFINHFSNIQNAIHGRKMTIILSEDPTFYYIGRVSVNEWKSDKNIGKIVIECDCEPYKYKKYLTTFTETINGTREVILLNLRKWVVPVFKSTGEMKITFNNNVYNIASGEYTLDDVVFKDGKNLLTLEGNATVTIEYQERGF